MSSRLVNERFWVDPYTANLDPIEKLMFLYLLTNPSTNLVGIYELDTRRMAFETGIDKDMVTKILERFERDKKIVCFEGWVIICKWAKYQNHNSPQIKAGYERILKELPAKIKEKLYGIDTLYIPYADGIDTLSYLTLLNSTLPNSTLLKPNHNGEGSPGMDGLPEGGEGSKAGEFDIKTAFEKWFKFYPRSGDKAITRERFEQEVQSKADYDKLLSATRTYKSETAERDMKYIKYPVSFLDDWRKYA